MLGGKVGDTGKSDSSLVYHKPKVIDLFSFNNLKMAARNE